MSDLWYSARSLMHARGFTVAAVLTFALGMGINVAVFSVVDRMLFRPLPYADPERLVQLHHRTISSGAPYAVLDHAIMVAVRERATTIEELAYASGDASPRVIAGFGDAPVRLAPVTYTLLSAVGVRPVLGRDFTEEDAIARPPQAPAKHLTEEEEEAGNRPVRAVIITHEAWQHRFGGSADILIRSVGSPTAPLRIVGVLPPGFLLPTSQFVEHFDGIVVSADRLRGPAMVGATFVAPVARLRSGASLEAAQAEVDVIVSAMRSQSTFLQGAIPASGPGVQVKPLATGLFLLYRPYLWLIVTAVAIVLLIACVNLATLMLARGRSRDHEAAVRTSLGASRGRLIAVALFEATLLCFAGSVVALGLCYAAQHVLLALIPPAFKVFAVTPLDPRIVALTLAAAGIIAAIAGILPAIRTSRVDVLELLTRGGPGSIGRFRGATGLIAAEVALGVVLVTGATVSIRSFAGMVLPSAGMEPADLYRLTVMAGPTHRPLKEDPARLAQELAQRALTVLEHVRAAPGVVAAGAVNQFPIGVDVAKNTFWRDRAAAGAVWGVTAGAIEALAPTLQAGRLLNDADVSARALVAVVNQEAVKVLWPGVEVSTVPGRFLDTTDGRRQVVGVIADMRPRPGERALPALYLPLSAAEVPRWSGAVIVALRLTRGQELDVTALRASLERQFGRSRVRVSISEVTREITPWLQRPRFQAALFGSLAVIALLVTAVGVYAIASFDVVRRRGELGIRMTLGASPRDIRRLVARDTLKPVLVGLIGGLCLTWWAGPLVQAFLFEVNARDPVTFTGVAALLIVTSILAGWLPARRASRVDPVETLRAT